MPVQILELGEVEARGRPPDAVEIEPADHVFHRHDLVVAMAPAEPHEIIAQGLGQIAHGPIGLDPERAVALGELGAVRPMDQGHMGEDRRLPAERR